MEEEFDNEEYLDSLPPSIREDMESGNKGAWTVGPAEAAAGLMIAPQLIKPAIKTWGLSKVLDVGINTAFPDSEDNKFDKWMEAAEPLHPLVEPTKKGIKATRLMLEKIFDQRVSPEDLPSLNLAESHKRHPQITKLSDLKKQAKNRRILDETSIDDGYVEEIVEHGDDVIYPEGSIEADIQANTQALGAERTGKVSKSDVPLKKSIYKGVAITNVEELDRAAAALVQRRIGTLSGIEFNKWTKEATADLQQTYKHITSGELNAHHNNIVKSGISLHEGRTGPESMLIESWLLNKGVASGNNPLNNNLIPEQVHGLIHKWMNERVGKKYLTGLIGELNSPLRKQWEQLPIDHPDVKKVVEQYADYVNGATERTAELMQAYYQIWGPESQITASTLEELYTKLGINELEYNQLIKPGLSGKDARMFAQGYGPKKIKVTWADGTTESIYERLLDELNNDPQLASKIDALNRPQVKVGDFSNEPTSLTPAQQRVKRWNDEYEELTSMKREGIKLTRTEKNRMKELKGLIYYQPDIPGMLFKVFDERIPKDGPFNESHGGWRYKK